MEQVRQAAKRIDASDVVSLLREVYPEGVRGRNEAEALLAFDREFKDPAPEWRGFIAEAVADHLLRRSTPVGVISSDKAHWLINAIAPSGRIATAGGVEALVRTIEQAAEIPHKLAAFAIRTVVKDANSDRLDAKNVVRLRRILEAGTGSVSAEEAEALFDLHDEVAGASNHASFDDLFFRAITGYLLSASNREVLPRAQSLSREPRRDAGHAIEAECAAWLASRIMRDGRPTFAERALLTLIEHRAEPDPHSGRSIHRAA